MKKNHQSILDKLPQPFFVLAPMDDVTDTVFRQIVAGCAPPDLYFTEFVNVDGLQSPGRPRLLKKLQLGPHEGTSRVSRLDGVQGAGEQRTEAYMQYVEGAAQPVTPQSAKSADGVSGSAEQQVSATGKLVPIFAQLWGIKPENFYKTTKELIKMGFNGVDINLGCPVKKVIKSGACAALINNRELAGEIIEATREGAGKNFPVSVKTRVGFTTVDMSWVESLLLKKLDLLSIHGRTAKQLSKVPADWDLIGQARQMRDSLYPTTLIVGNGDVMTRRQGQQLADKYQLDGIMIGRGIFHDPFIFANPLSRGSPWSSWSKEQKLQLFEKHIKLFAKTWPHGEYKFESLKKFAKVYINGFDGASELRSKFMAAHTPDEALSLLY